MLGDVVARRAAEELRRIAVKGSAVAGALRPLDFGAHIAARVLQRGDKIIGRMGRDRVLEIQHAEPRNAGTLRQPEQILGMKIAQAHHRCDRVQSSIGLRDQAGHGKISRLSPCCGQIPIAAELRQVAQRLCIEDGKPRWRRPRVQREQKICDLTVKPGLPCGILRDQPCDQIVSQILQHQKPIRLRKDLRR